MMAQCVERWGAVAEGSEDTREQAVIRVLLGSIEKLIVENTALRMALQVVGSEETEWFVRQSKAELTERGSGTFSWLRGTLLSALQDNRLPPSLLPEWEREIQRLVDGASNLDLGE